MKIGHIHIGFKDLDAAVEWMNHNLEVEPGFRNANMAAFYFDGIGFVFDRSEEDSAIAVALSAESCDADFKKFLSKGVKVLEAPANQPWGVRTAYVEGPGKVTVEIEETLK
jgi:catechol 2,3-dioxygenase-like lactoylglutathione lyase family enzyme